MEITMDSLLEIARDVGASDVHITVGLPPKMRVNGTIEDIIPHVLTSHDTQTLVLSIMNERQVATLKRDGEADFSYSTEALGRFRCNVFRQKNSFAAVLRLINTVIPAPEKLGLPWSVMDLAKRKRGLVLVTGPTGSGKSTLTQLLNGLEKPSSGTIYYNDEDIQADGYERRKLRQKVGLVFQYPEHQLFEVSVIKDVEFGPRNLGLSNLEIEKRSFDALKQVGLSDDLLDVDPFALSGGQKRRVAIAGVLAMQPEVLILDEPTAGLDPAGRTEILELLKKLHEENDITVILVSHSMDDVARYAGRILVMNQGELVLDGEPQKVFRYRDELRKIGLDVPQSTNILYELRDRGMAVGTEGITPEQAAECIADSLRRQS